MHSLAPGSLTRFSPCLCLQDIGLIIKPLPVVCQWVGFGPINLAELLQARVCYNPLL